MIVKPKSSVSRDLYFNMKSVYITLCVVLFASTTYCQDENVFRSDYQYIAEAGGWLKVHQIPLNWEEARLRCAYEGAMLTSPTSHGLISVFKSITVKFQGPVYTGIHATVSKGYFNSLDGIPLDDIPVQWLADNPNIRDDNENCLVYYDGGFFEDVDCNKRYPYICYKKHSKDLFMTECGTTDTKYKMDVRTNRCYKFHWIARNNNVAAAICSAEGGHLAIINSETEAEVLRTVFADDPKWNSSYSNLVRLGFNNWGESNFFGTLHGQSLEDAGYEKWAINEPSFYYMGKPQTCGGMLRDALLDDTTCEEQLPFICEKHPDTLRKSTIDMRFSDQLNIFKYINV